MSVIMTLEDDIDTSRGDMIVRKTITSNWARNRSISDMDEY